ncbi:MAG TPA: multicopper oxidase family protein [Thermoanaerobaculia bacterium]|nr:multicopper oxidase family protein [Thermoanaerobaculia bacterium]
MPSFKSLRFLCAPLLLLASSALGQAVPELAPDSDHPPLYDPEPLRPTRGVLSATLRLGYSKQTIGKQTVELRTYNGKAFGPTFWVAPGDTIKVRLINDLPCPTGKVCKPTPIPCLTGKEEHTLHAHFETLAGSPDPKGFNTTNLHTHGLHVSPNCSSDNVLLNLDPGGHGFHFEFKIPKNHPSGTFWYHAHVHGSTAIQVSSGVEGALIVSKPGGFDDVPGIKGARSRMLLFQQVPYKCNFANAKDWSCKPGEVGKVEDFGQQFGPNAWKDSGRYTTINGQLQPTIDMRPGEVQRWRLIHGGVRETIMAAVGKKNGDDFIVEKGWLHEIALDGLPTGTVTERDRIELEPGYRVDVMAKAPMTPGKYYLIDEPSAPLLVPFDVTPEAALNAAPEPRKVLAIIEVGDKPPCTDPRSPCHRSLPDPAKLKPFRLPDITAREVAGREPQKVEFDIAGNPLKFMICGKDFDPKMPPRKLEFGKADTWLISSKRANHPFHIHVNPFQVKDETGQWTWKDTLLIKPGTTYEVRTRYETFRGDFVLHCHILDHEDEGMMELVQIAPGPQPVKACPQP